MTTKDSKNRSFRALDVACAHYNCGFVFFVNIDGRTILLKLVKLFGIKKFDLFFCFIMDDIIRIPGRGELKCRVSDGDLIILTEMEKFLRCTTHPFLALVG